MSRAENFMLGFIGFERVGLGLCERWVVSERPTKSGELAVRFCGEALASNISARVPELRTKTAVAYHCLISSRLVSIAGFSISLNREPIISKTGYLQKLVQCHKLCCTRCLGGRVPPRTFHKVITICHSTVGFNTGQPASG